MKTTFALVSKYEDAKQVVDQLMDKNIGKEKINIIAQKSAVESSWDVNQRTIDTDVTSEVGNKEVEGLDALLGRQQPVRTNTAGELYAAGEIAGMVAKAVAGPGQIGGLKEALVDIGVADPSAEQFAEGVQAGEMLLFIRTDDDQSSMVQKILSGVGGVRHSTAVG